MNDWNTDWDPYESLKTSEHNIQQLILAVNHSSELIKQLTSTVNHQQEVIQQLMFQNRKLNQMLTLLRNEVNDIRVKSSQ